MRIADRIVAELEIEHFFNIQLVGEHVIEINPRISTIVYQEDLNLPYLGVKRALGEISAEELAALRTRVRPAARRSATSTRSSGTRRAVERRWRGARTVAHPPPPTHPRGVTRYVRSAVEGVTEQRQLRDDSCAAQLTGRSASSTAP